MKRINLEAHFVTQNYVKARDTHSEVKGPEIGRAPGTWELNDPLDGERPWNYGG
jgi:hypothetical protein